MFSSFHLNKTKYARPKTFIPVYYMQRHYLSCLTVVICAWITRVQITINSIGDVNKLSPLSRTTSPLALLHFYQSTLHCYHHYHLILKINNTAWQQNGNVWRHSLSCQPSLWLLNELTSRQSTCFREKIARDYNKHTFENPRGLSSSGLRWLHLNKVKTELGEQ